jgi:2,3-bisphosphoglycerate-independent phosphoglycerate mutase
MLMPDHPTPIAKKTHTNDPVPFAIRGLGEPDDVQIYTEKEVQAKGSYGLIQAVDLLDMVFKE